MLLLFENIIGYSLFFCKEDYSAEINNPTFHDFFSDYQSFISKFELINFIPFSCSNHALQNVACISESICNYYLSDFLIKSMKNCSTSLKIGVSDSKLAANIYQKTYIKTVSNETAIELIRIIRENFEKFADKIIIQNIYRVQCSIAHLFSRSKMKINQLNNDNSIVQLSALLEQLDNDTNVLSMICKEWYGWHFPELSTIIKDHYLYSLVVRLIGNRNKLISNKLSEIGLITMNNSTAIKVFKKAKSSLGSKISKIDLLLIKKFCLQIILISELRENFLNYIKNQIKSIAPNLTELLGEIITAKLISVAGSLKNLAKLPSSTVQLLGAEKALFRSLKNQTKTPKYGLIFNSNFILKSKYYYKGKISRYLANKAAMAARIDYFSKIHTNLFGQAYKKQIINKIKIINQIN
nr:nucleolar protein [Cryptomonas curvata]